MNMDFLFKDSDSHLEQKFESQYDVEYEGLEIELNEGIITVEEYNKRLNDLEHELNNPHKSDSDCFEDDLPF